MGDIAGSGGDGGQPVSPCAAGAVEAATSSAAPATEDGAAGGVTEAEGAVVRELRRRNAELVELQRARDEMASRFIHDMRSPMMVISANLEFVISTAGISDEERADAQPVCARTRVMAAPLEVTLETGALPETALSVDAPLVSHALEVLAEHVLERTPPGGTMRVSCAAEGGGVCVRVDSTAPSMSAEEHDQLFDRLGGAAILGGKTKVGAGLPPLPPGGRGARRRLHAGGIYRAAADLLRLHARRRLSAERLSAWRRGSRARARRRP